MTEFLDPDNPYAAPGQTIGRGRVVVRQSFAPPTGSVFFVDHRLTDQDLRRFSSFDLIYDPLPFLGFLPRYVIVAMIPLGMAGWATWKQHGPTWLAVGSAAATAIFTLLILNKMMSRNRKAATAGGYTEGRRVTISLRGVQVTIDGHPPESLYGLGEFFEPWTKFRKVEFRDQYLFLWKTGRARLVIPERAFPTADKAEEFARAAAGWVATSG